AELSKWYYYDGVNEILETSDDGAIDLRWFVHGVSYIDERFRRTGINSYGILARRDATDDRRVLHFHPNTISDRGRIEKAAAAGLVGPPRRRVNS
ncbi:MAG TPA: hypothetical protein VNT79_17120, partial [Phycisphaerae bacterium]|nr:hypothetical protein [Phycisphaerae bacterium]